MGLKRKTKSQTAAAVLIIFNLITLVTCFAIFGISIWVIASPSSLIRVIQIYGNSYLKALITDDALDVQLGIGGTLLAGFFIFISLMGLYGAITGSQFLLFMYATLVLLLLLLECALLFYVTSNIVEKGIRSDEQWAHVLRVTFECCDRNFTSLEHKTPPWSCCGVADFPKNCTNEKVYKQGCQYAVGKWLEEYRTIMYTTLAILHVILFACAYIRRALTSASHDVT